MKQFKINYLVRYFEGTDVDFTHSHRSVMVNHFSKLQVQEEAFIKVAACVAEDDFGIKSIEIGEIEEVKNEG